MAEPDIRLLIGVSGGGSVDGKSGKLIEKELKQIASQMTGGHMPRVQVAVDINKTKPIFQQQLQKIANGLTIEAPVRVKIPNNIIGSFNTTSLEAAGRKYYKAVDTIVEDVKRDLSSLGTVNIDSVFKNPLGDIERFTASIERAGGVTEKLRFKLAELNSGSEKFRGFVQMDSILSDKSTGTSLQKTVNYLSGIETKIANINSKTLINTSKPLLPGMEQFEEYDRKLQEINARIEEISGTTVSFSDIHKREINRMVADLQRYAQELQKSAYANSGFDAKSFAVQKTQMQADLDVQIKKWTSAGLFGGEFEQAVNHAKSLLDAATDPTGLNEYIAKLRLLQTQFKSFNVDNAAWDKIAQSNTLYEKIETTRIRIQNLKTTYSSFVSDPKLMQEWNALFDESQVITTQKEVENLNAKVGQFEQRLVAAGKHGASVFAQLAQNFSKMAMWMVMGTVIGSVTRGVRGVYAAVVDLDSEMTELKKITDETDAVYDKFLTNAFSKAKALGSSITDYVKATSSFARLGNSIPDSSNLAETTMVYQNVGDEIDSADEAAKSIISTMKAWNIEAEKSMSIADKFNEVGNKFAISSGGIGKALQRSAASLSVSGNTLDEAIGLIVAANNVVQNPEKVGTMWQTVTMRIRGAKTELTEAGLETEGMAESTSKLRDEVKALTNVDGLGGFDILVDDKTFKSTYEIVKGIGSVFKDMSDIDQAALLELLAGKRQSNALASALLNVDDAIKAVETSMNSSGSAWREHERWLESVEAKQQQFTAQYQEFAHVILDSDLIKGALDTGTGLLGWLTSITEKLGALPVLVAAASGIRSVASNKGLFRVDNGKNWGGSGIGISTYFGISNRAFADLTQQIEVDYQALSKWEDMVSKGVISTESFNEAMHGASSRARSYAVDMKGAAGSAASYKAEQVAAAGATQGMGIAAKAASVGVQILNTAMNMLIGMGISLAIQAIVQGISHLINKEKELRESLIEDGKTAADNSEKLYELLESYVALSQAIDEGTGSRDELMSVQDKLIQQLSSEGAAVDTLKSKYGDLTDEIIKASQEQLKLDMVTAASGAAEAKKQAVSDLEKWFGGTSNYSVSGEDSLEALQYLENNGYSVSKGTAGGVIFLPNSTTTDLWSELTFEQIDENYKTLQKMAAEVGEKFGPDNPVTAALTKGLTEYDDALKSVYTQINEANKTAARYAIAMESGMDGSMTLEQFKKHRQSIIERLKGSENFDAGGSLSADELIDGILASNEQYSRFIAELSKDGQYKGQLGNLAGDAGKAGAELEKLIEILANLKSSYNALENAKKEMVLGGLSQETIDALAKAEENYLDYLYEENGLVMLNTEAWESNAKAKAQSEVVEIQDEIDALSERNAVLQESLDLMSDKIAVSGTSGGSVANQMASMTNEINANTKAIAENQGKLAVYNSLFGGITGDLNAYADALTGFTHIVNAVEVVSDSFKTLADLQAEVANGFTISLEKAIEFGSAYPEILNNAKLSADGQIILNENIVNSFLQAKKAEIDAEIDTEIAKLEADKAVLAAKIESAQAQLDIAKSIGDGEGQISKELAEYRINAGNAVAQALIDAGVDEATAFKLAALAMAQNVEEFDRVAAEVCTDVNGNFNQAAFDLAQTMYKNLTNVKTDLASVARQAHSTAKAIAGVQSGKVEGSSSVIGGSSGGVTGSGINLNLVKGKFVGTDYQYEAKKSGLEDFISNIELDVSNYKDAIAQIDGQITTLKALKELPLKHFKSDTKGGKSGDTKKEVEEYIAELDKLYLITKQLVGVQEEINSLEAKNDLLDNGDYAGRMANAQKLLDLKKRENDLLHEQSEQRRKIIQDNVDELRDAGFEIDYDPTNNDLIIKNMEHLNEVTGGTTEETNELRKYLEGLIDTTEDMNDANVDSSLAWFKNAKAAKEYAKQLMAIRQEEADEWLDVREHNIGLWENQGGNEAQIFANYQQMMDYVHGLANEYRAAGYAEDSKEIRNLQNLWWKYYNAQQDLMEDMDKKRLDTLNDQKDAMQGILDLTIQLVKKGINDEIASLEKARDIYREIIDAKIESIELSERERSYQDRVDGLTGELSKLQAQADIVALDDSREGKMKHSQLLEQINEKQKELDDEQHNYSIDNQKDALEREYDLYADTLEDKITILKGFLDDNEYLTLEAYKRIDAGGDTLFDDLTSYAKKYTDTSSEELQSMWDKAMAAAKEYASFASGMSAIKGEINDLENGGHAQKTINDSSIIDQMKRNSAAWHKATAIERKRLEAENMRLGTSIGATRKSDGRWYRNGVPLYHTGGVIGDRPTARQKDILMYGERGEVVLTQKAQRNFGNLIKLGSPLAGLFAKMKDNTPLSSISEAMKYKPLSPPISALSSQATQPIQFQLVNNGKMDDNIWEKIKPDVRKMISDSFLLVGRDRG